MKPAFTLRVRLYRPIRADELVDDEESHGETKSTGSRAEQSNDLASDVYGRVVKDEKSRRPRFPMFKGREPPSVHRSIRTRRDKPHVPWIAVCPHPGENPPNARSKICAEPSKFCSDTF